MANDFGDGVKGDAGLQLVDDESVAQVVDISIFDFCNFEIAINAVSNIADEERMAIFGNEQAMAFFGFWPFVKIAIDSFSGRPVEGNHSAGVRFIGSDY